MTLTALSVVKQKKYSPEHGVLTSAWKSPLHLKEWFLHAGSKLEKNETYNADTFVIHDTAVCLHLRLDRLL